MMDATKTRHQGTKSRSAGAVENASLPLLQGLVLALLDERTRKADEQSAHGVAAILGVLAHFFDLVKDARDRVARRLAHVGFDKERDQRLQQLIAFVPESDGFAGGILTLEAVELAVDLMDLLFDSLNLDHDLAEG
jgi:hypothetical protein